MWSRQRPPKPRRCLDERLERAERRLARGRLDAAVRQLLELAAEAQGDPARLNRIGDCLVRAGCLQPGLALFERVGQAWAEEGFWAKAIAVYRKILRHDPWRSDVETALAFLYQRSGLPTGAGVKP